MLLSCSATAWHRRASGPWHVTQKALQAEVSMIAKPTITQRPGCAINGLSQNRCGSKSLLLDAGVLCPNRKNRLGSVQELLPRLPAAPPCLVLGPHSYNVKCIYPYTRRVCIGSRQPTGEVAPSRLHRLATAEVDRLAENTNSD